MKIVRRFFAERDFLQAAFNILNEFQVEFLYP